jgi:predicted metalloprotease with PDZ domain
MTKFTFGIENPHSQYVHISAVFDTSTVQTVLQLPSWRPGRYELGNFAKNINNFIVFNDQGKIITADKITKDSWAVDTSSTASITVKYKYYAAELNAGSTFLDANQLYVNPVNCCVYTEETYNSEVHIDLDIPDEWQVASSLTPNGNDWKVESIEELLDTPFIASEGLLHNEYESHGVKFHVWFNGEVKPDWKRLLTDFKAFTDKQIEKFNEFPVKEYHFLNQILPYKAYHGVEHQKSTVISLGPSYAVFDELYAELLGVSSHELYHTWNVKAIRPIEMFPYDFTKENYSKLGYLCEGVTTYQGDLFLFKSGVFDEQAYFKELNAQLQRHFDNHGRFNYSVAESSFDTWVDGYTTGAPGRKVSIYTEGCLLAFVTDVRIRKATSNKYGLDEVMKRLYFNFSIKNKGVSAANYQAEIEAVSGESFQAFFDDYINGNKPYESIITDALDCIGLELIHKPVESYSGAKLGFKAISNGKGFIVKSIYPGGPADTAGVMLNDQMIAVNNISLDGELDKWLSYFDDDAKEITINRNGHILRLVFPEVNRFFYNSYSVAKIEAPSHNQVRTYEAWKQ